MITRILVFDTKTTGLPRNYKKAEEDLNNYPHCLELGAKIIELDLNSINTEDSVTIKDVFTIQTLINPQRGTEKVTIHPKAQQTHGISIEECEEDGNMIETVGFLFQGMASTVDFIVAHNYNLQRNVMVSELLRLGIKLIAKKNCKQFCTMLYSTPILKLTPKDITKYPDSYRYPTIDELYRYLFDSEITNKYEHDNAFNNTLATEDCLLELFKTDNKMLSWFKREVEVLY